MSQFYSVWRNLKQFALALTTGAREPVALKLLVLVAGFALGTYFTDSVEMLFSGWDQPLDESLITCIGVSLTLLPAVSVLILVNLLQKAKRG